MTTTPFTPYTHARAHELHVQFRSGTTRHVCDHCDREIRNRFVQVENQAARLKCVSTCVFFFPAVAICGMCASRSRVFLCMLPGSEAEPRIHSVTQLSDDVYIVYALIVSPFLVVFG